MNKKLFAILMIAMIVFSMGFGLVFATPNGNTNNRWSLRDKLTEEEIEELYDTVDEMREDGATPVEIHEFVMSYLEEHGLEVPVMLRRAYLFRARLQHRIQELQRKARSFFKNRSGK